ncbi:hypothetical protein [Kitasatospora cinereorecta]|uniref:DUF1273 family protein n=1 Tax=Kitasatospora cinereorecta TaxID=285560 RepID=A0ABW0V9G6_9ACTN
MTVIAVTGHLDLAGAGLPSIRAELLALLGPYARGGTLTGLSCIAPGADALFADVVLELGGRLEVVLPSARYRAAAVAAGYTAYAEEFDRLCRAAAEVLVLPAPEPDSAAYVAANAELLRRADRLVAVWDGGPGNGPGGTAHMVAAARAAGVPVHRVWPPGAARTG